MSSENVPNPTQSTPLRRRKARPFSVMVSKKDAEALPDYPMYSDHISPQLAAALSASITSKSPDRNSLRASINLGAPNSPMTPQSKSNVKKRMASELLRLSDLLNELEQERSEEAELHASLLRSVEELSNKKQKTLSKLSDEQDDLEIEYHKVKAEYLTIKKERDALQAKMDDIVTKTWKNHVYSVQANDWFADYEKNFY